MVGSIIAPFNQRGRFTSESGFYVIAAGPGARFSAAFLDQPHVDDAHAAVDRLAHVVDGERGDGHGGQRLHLDAGAIERAHGRQDFDARPPVVVSRRQRHVDAGDPHRMTQRDELAGALEPGDGGDARDAEHVALAHDAGADGVERRALHLDGPGGDGDALGLGFGADVDHVRLAGVVEVSELGHARNAK